MSAPGTALQGVTVQGVGGISRSFVGVFVNNGDGPFSEAAVIDNVTFRLIGDGGRGVEIAGPAIVGHSRFVHAGDGIDVISSSRASIRDNVITGSATARFTTHGILVIGANVDLLRNDISGFITSEEPFDLDQDSAAIELISPARGSVGGLAAGTGNRIHDNLIGVFVATEGATIANNVLVNNFELGLLARRALASGNRFLHNIFTDSVFQIDKSDCLDQTVGSGTAGTANIWLDNTGAAPSSSFPAAICPP
jgi:nitrous oxidase accessory protein NosD